MGTKIKKTKAKTKVSTKASNKVQEYYDSIDFREWWESFASDSNKNGTLKYKTVWQLLIAKTKIKWQRDFLWWLLGPKSEQPEDSLYKDYPQLDFEHRRSVGHWHSSDNIEKFSKEVKSKGSALEKLKEIGSTVDLELINSFLMLKREIDKEYAGRLFLPQLDAKENEVRLEQYMRLQQQLMALQIQAQKLFSQTQGLDVDRLSEFFALFGKGMGEKASEFLQLVDADASKVIEGEQNKTPASRALQSIIDMTSQKIANRGLEAPPGIDEIIEREAANNKPQLVIPNRRA